LRTHAHLSSVSLWLLLVTGGCHEAPEVAGTANDAGGHEQGEAGNDSRYKPGEPSEPTQGDPEEAWAAIPNAMRPARLLPDMKKKLLVPNVAQHGLAVFTDIVAVQPGEDVTYCTYTNVITDRVTYIHDTAGAQSRYGHHAILQFSSTPREPGTQRCNPEDLDVQQGQIIGGTGGEGTGFIALPPNVVSEVPAGAQFVINHHWINVGENATEVQAEMITVPPDSDEELVVARALIVVGLGFQIPARQTSQHSVTCMLDREVKLLSLLGHQHSWGKHVKAERVGSETEVLFDHDFHESMISEPFTRYFPVTEPYRITSGQGLRMTCDWDNTTDSPLTFPREMCVMFGWQIGADADSRCVEGTWIH
jgi:hypothetical protein